MIDSATMRDDTGASLSRLGTRSASPKERPVAGGKTVQSRPRRMTTGFLSGLAGFIVGAVFWHIVGFWSFVSTIVLKGSDEPGASRVGAAPAAPQRIKETGRLKESMRYRDFGANAPYLPAAVAAGNCAEVSVSRANGRAQVQACTQSVAELPSGTEMAERRDIAVKRPADPRDSAGWTVQVQAGD